MYLDPSFGGMLLQVIVVIAAVGGAIVYSFRRKIRELFSGKKDDSGSVDVKPSADAGDDDDMIDTLSDDE